MISLYDELSGKLAKDPSLTRRSGPRQDIGLLLFSERDNLSRLWKAADRCPESGEGREFRELRVAVERLRPIFGERDGGVTT